MIGAIDNNIAVLMTGHELMTAKSLIQILPQSWLC